MSSIQVRVPTPLRGLTGGKGTLEGNGATVREVLEALEDQNRGLLEQLLDETGQLRKFVNLYIDGDNIRSLNGLDSAVQPGSVISLIPAVAGGLPSARQRRLAELRQRIPEISPGEAHQFLREGGIVIDVREPDEVAAGSPPGALRIVRGFLEMRIEDKIADFDTPLALICGGGNRSLLAADDLLQLGYTQVRSVAGGFSRWKDDGLPVDIPQSLGHKERERYSRHLLIPEVGEKGQLKLLESKVLLVGAGGLGSPAALYLAAAGVGTLGIVDDDVVDRSNLQRQILHTDERVGTSKVDSARDTLLGLNPDTNVVTHPVRLTSENVEDIFANYDLILDGTDNFATRYLINDASVKLGLPNVHGSIFRFDGQVSVFWPGRPGNPGPCYRCLFAEPPPPELAPSCAEAGVLGILPGVIGTLQAVETIKILLGIGEPLVGKLLCYDALTAEFSNVRVDRDPECRYCGDHVQSFPGYVDYDQFCSGVTISEGVK
ncbi:MAG: molybdopterin-synthase adenylyltransferase MoeB [Gammaproteobacteria bacterium]|nr:molybdopterin-synthase adenylyltransferase MoeB [Gammaproteobacteria bacterium]